MKYIFEDKPEIDEENKMVVPKYEYKDGVFIYSWKIVSIPKEEPEFEETTECEGYEKIVNELIRERYSISDEIAILRQKESKPDEFQEYYEFCEECKRKALNNAQDI